MLRRNILYASAAIALIVLVAYYLLIVAVSYASFPFGDIMSRLFVPELYHALKLSLATSTVATVMAMGVGIPAAYALSRYEGRLHHLFDAVIDIPIFLSPIAVGAMLLIFFSSPAGRFFGWADTEVTFNVAGIVVAQFTIVTALAVRLVKARFDDIDPRYELIARSLGCGPFGSFTRVVLPLARRGIAAAAVVVWARCMGEFGATVMLAGASRNTRTLPVSIYLHFAAADVENALAVIGILLAVSIVTLIGIKYLTTGKRRR